MVNSDKQEPVFELIKSMSKAEKRNFKLYVTRLSGNQDAKFLFLFDFLDSLEEYDESKILERCPIKKEQLPNTKAHLLKQILVSIRLLNVQHSDTMQLREQLDFAQILYNKGLYRMSAKVLDKCYAQAQKTEQHSVMIDIIHLMFQIETSEVSSGITERTQELSRQAAKRCEIISNANDLYMIAIQLFELHHKLGYARSQKDLDFIENFFAPKLKSYNLQALSFLEKFYYFQAMAWFHYIKHNFVLSYRYACLWVELFDSNQKMKFRMYDSYLRGYARLMDGLYMMRQGKKLGERIDALESECATFAKINENAGLISKNMLFAAKINKVFLEGDFKKGLSIVESFDTSNLSRVSGSVRMWTHYKIACLYFGNGDYKKCMQSLGKIISTKQTELRRDVQCYAKMLYLIASYEAGIDYNLDYQIRSLYAFLVKMNDLQEVQKEMLNFLKRLNKIYEKDLKDELQKLYDNIKPYEHHPYLQRTFYYLDIISWLESKLSGESVSAIIQRKFNQRRS